jgi:hypothetical protein
MKIKTRVAKHVRNIGTEASATRNMTSGGKAGGTKIDTIAPSAKSALVAMGIHTGSKWWTYRLATCPLPESAEAGTTTVLLDSSRRLVSAPSLAVALRRPQSS